MFVGGVGGNCVSTLGVGGTGIVGGAGIVGAVFVSVSYTHLKLPTNREV